MSSCVAAALFCFLPQHSLIYIFRFRKINKHLLKKMVTYGKAMEPTILPVRVS